MSERNTMNGKPVITTPAKTVVNFKSGFEHKLLCDGPTFSLGDACAYSCSFCYVPSVMLKRLSMLKKSGSVPEDTKHENVVLRRADALIVLERQLKSKKFTAADKGKVIYASPLVDVAANLDLARETVEACKLILKLTPWDIRLLSKSTFLPHIAKALAPDYGGHQCQRIIYGVSTGTFDDKLAAAFEQGCPKVSKRIDSLRELRDMGCRTFGMICPSLPQKDDGEFAAEAYANLKDLVKEHVWAEVINVRGDSLVNTWTALSDAGYAWEASELEWVSNSKKAWEEYARRTFLAHAKVWDDQVDGQPRLRFLQYVNNDTIAWWNAKVTSGAVLL